MNMTNNAREQRKMNKTMNGEREGKENNRNIGEQPSKWKGLEVYTTQATILKLPSVIIKIAVKNI